MIRVWQFHEAPDEYQNMSGNAGDEDYIMHVPPGWQADGWLDYATEVGRAFGVCRVEKINLPDGSTIYIGSHA